MLRCWLKKVKINSFSISFCLSLAFLLIACGADDNDPPFVEPKPKPVVANKKPLLPLSAKECEKINKWTYKSYGEGFFREYCTSCHHSELVLEDRSGAPIEIDFDIVENIQILKYKIFSKINSKSMPPGRNLSKFELFNVKTWLRCGAPIN